MGAPASLFPESGDPLLAVVLPPEEAGLLAETMRILTDKIAFYLQHRCYGAIETEALIFSNEKGALGETAGFRDMLAKIEAEAKETKI